MQSKTNKNVLENLTIDSDERKDYEKLKTDIKEGKITSTSINSMISSIWHKRANIGRMLGSKAYIKHYLLDTFKCCLRRNKSTQSKIYRNGVRKFNK